MTQPTDQQITEAVKQWAADVIYDPDLLQPENMMRQLVEGKKIVLDLSMKNARLPTRGAVQWAIGTRQLGCPLPGGRG